MANARGGKGFNNANIPKRKDDWRGGGYLREVGWSPSRESKMGVTRGYEIVAGEPRGMTRVDKNTTRNTMRAGVQRSKGQTRKQKRS